MMYKRRRQLSYSHRLVLSGHSRSIFYYSADWQVPSISLNVCPPAFSCSPSCAALSLGLGQWSWWTGKAKRGLFPYHLEALWLMNVTWQGPVTSEPVFISLQPKRRKCTMRIQINSRIDFDALMTIGKFIYHLCPFSRASFSLDGDYKTSIGTHSAGDHNQWKCWSIFS